jgi:glycosyltransferase involved in cell wall biosynthesis
MGFFKNTNCMVVPNSHGYHSSELSLFQQAADNESLHSLRLLFIGRLVQEKGIQELCEAFVLSTCDYPEMTLDVIGWGPCEDRIKKIFGHNSKIYFHGALFGKQKEALIQQADLVVLPSLCPESFGIVLVEAYAFGKPVIASRVGGIPEVVKEGETGFLVPPGDVDELAQKIQFIARNPDILKSMREACFEAAAQYTTDKITRKYLKLYKKS